MDKLAFQKHLGVKLRRRRRLMGMTLVALAEDCGIAYQQIQKYEVGMITLSAAGLWKLACALGVPVSYFYDGLPAYTGPRPQPKLEKGLARAFELHLAARRDAQPGRVDPLEADDH